MKIGKGTSSVLGTPLNHIVFVLLGFFFGFLSAISFNQQLCVTSSWYSPQTGHVVIKPQDKASNIVLEDNALEYRVERERERPVVEAVPSHHCPPCEQFEKFAQVAEVLLQPVGSIANSLKQRHGSQAVQFSNGRHNRTSSEKSYRNASGWVCRNPTLVDKLPQTFIHRTTDYYFHRLVGTPKNDVKQAPKNLLALAVGIKQNVSVNAIIEKFPREHFQVILFHYDDVVDEWGQFEWNDRVIHVQSTGQSKWWFAKRFLHPDVVAPYEYIFVWDEDLGVENFDPMEYIEIMKRHELQISQPAVDGASSWPITVRQSWTGKEVHKRTPWEGLFDNCTKSKVTPPCAGFVEIQAPVFVSKVWRCVWHLIQNDLVMAWGLDFELQACINGAPHEHIGIVDTQWVVHNKIPSLGTQGAEADNPKRLRGEVIARSFLEWSENKKRWADGLKSQKDNIILRE
ncbi:hypothetical protein KC19_3G180500 [Ceratodon purpureus]|uniref:Uncharacterized protein n=1 Tax=Ceratodon purpureus TaxID=3225 RepID=A0A8T0IM48_CERPU|nr:hypothetical protein KC19_3G180500 [Ceratodon purpureus]